MSIRLVQLRDANGGRLLAAAEQAGFRRVAETAARSAGLPRWLMRLELTAPAGGTNDGEEAADELP